MTAHCAPAPPASANENPSFRSDSAPQRREFYRLSVPRSHLLTLTIPVPGRSAPITGGIINLSLHGALITLPEHVANELHSGDEFADCHFGLPGQGAITTRIRLHAIEVYRQFGTTRIMRVGCEFVDLAGKAETLIQRYIFTVERQRIAGDLGD